MRKDYIVNISDYVEDFESDLRYKRLIKIIYCKDCTSEEDAVKKAKAILTSEGGHYGGIVDIIFDDEDAIFFDVKVIELHNDTVIYSY